ncbi:MATE family efflux transporter [Roseisalinus antarcticus]|uniref:Multidrug-efflux transporter n=1 Tax=Roseisalinus antarcticus TaxID=254357 RepID=A0A1Y5SUZ1_9RHOB|nr:MATE family efflux transporter [Roseisalinus antarcticus]SLN47604.1 Multidrug resistance protein MdtK [Roseisalinus antarcticus]
MSQTDRPGRFGHLGQGRTGHVRALLVLGLPLIGSNVAQNAIGFVDVVMLGWYDVTALAAVSIATPVFFTLFLLCAGFAWAVTPLVAEGIEADDIVAVRRVTRMGLWLSVAAGLAVMPVFWWSGPLLRALGQTDSVASQAQAYLRIAGWGVIPALFVVTLRSFLSALEITRIILIVTVASAILNAGLNWVLIFGNLGAPELGLQGAAIASVSLQVAAFFGLVAYTRRHCAEFDLFTRLWRFDSQIAARVFSLGLPMGLTTVAEAALFSFTAIMMGWINEIWLAAHGVALQLASMVFMVHLGLSQAATVRAGRAFGRRDEAALRAGGKAAMLLSGLVSGATVLLFLGVPAFLMELFVDPADPARDAIVAAGVTLLAIAALFQVVDAAQVMTIGLLRGVQDTAVPLLIATVSYYMLGLPAGYVFGFVFGLGGPGVWLGMVVGLGAAGIMLSLRFWLWTGRLAPRPGLSAPGPG